MKAQFVLEYLIRDAGNFKNYGSVVLENDLQLSLQDAEDSLHEKLIDGTYFYPSKWGIASLSDCIEIEDFEPWHEFLSLDHCEAQTSATIRISELLK